MAWTTPQFSRGQVDAAGRMLGVKVDDTNISEYLHALEVIGNWRSSHSFPLNTMQNGLRKRGLRIDPNALVAQRIKRLASIDLKLRRFPGLRLSQIQDIGGCRIVLSDVKMIADVVDSWQQSDVRHKLAKIDDYLVRPQRSGYRGVHLIYKYTSDRNPHFNDLRVELQVRSQLQHAWATAVETVGTFLRQSLKSSLGETQWLRFFALMGTAIAIQEGTSAVDGTPANERELTDELARSVDALDVLNRLSVFGNALHLFEERKNTGEYFILVLDAANQEVVVYAYPRSRLDKAQRDYLYFEESARETGKDAVLVSVNSVAALQKAYPNYFLDTRVFIQIVRAALDRQPLFADDIASIPARTLEHARPLSDLAWPSVNDAVRRSLNEGKVDEMIVERPD